MGGGGAISNPKKIVVFFAVILRGKNYEFSEKGGKRRGSACPAEWN